MIIPCDDAIEALRKHGLSSLPPIAIVLGSGLGPLADEVEHAISVPYEQIPGFPVPTVSGHAGRLVVGELEGLAHDFVHSAILVLDDARPFGPGRLAPVGRVLAGQLYAPDSVPDVDEGPGLAASAMHRQRVLVMW